MKNLALGLSILLLVAAGALLALAWLSRRAPERTFAAPGGQLVPCPDTPNCVSSQAARERVRVAPFELGDDPAAGFAALVELIAAEPGARIEARTDRYVHATFRTRHLGFVDDLELALDPAARVAHVRSASRIGHSDLGANRSRVAALHARWSDR